mmetsp:Transcript_44015/g.145842  ORF Transcript_44015/g.145842 Transcript_44015/m.145842 type:complete len:290 (-) Transcript_44015:627-1496(-)
MFLLYHSRHGPSQKAHTATETDRGPYPDPSPDRLNAQGQKARAACPNKCPNDQSGAAMWMWPSPRPDQNLIFGSFLLLVGPRLPGCAFCLRSTNPPPGSTAAAALSSFRGGGGSASESSESSPRLRFFFFLRLRSPPSSPSPSPFAFFEARKGSNAFRKSLLLSCGSAAPPSPSSSPSPSPSAPAPPPSTSGNGSASAFALRAAATSTAGVLGRMVVCSMSEKRGPSGSAGASGGGGGPLAEEAFATESSVVAFAAGGAYPWKASVTIDEKERAAMTVTDAMSAHRVRL